MPDLKTIAADLVAGLDLQYDPVGVTLYQEGDPLPAGVAFTTENLKSYCHALALAGQGLALLLDKDHQGCKLGTSVLGFESEDLERFLDDGVLEEIRGGSVRHRGGLRRHHPGVDLPGTGQDQSNPGGTFSFVYKDSPDCGLHRGTRAGHVAPVCGEL